MLALSQRINADIIVYHGNERLVIKVLDSRHDKARLGFDGPRSFRVIRGELDKPAARQGSGGGA